MSVGGVRCKAAVEGSKITATNMRQMASTMWASVEILQPKCASFYAYAYASLKGRE